MANNRKNFDAVEMSRKLREKTGRRLFLMSSKERLAFLNRRLNQWKATHQKSHSTSEVVFSR